MGSEVGNEKTCGKKLMCVVIIIVVWQVIDISAQAAGSVSPPPLTKDEQRQEDKLGARFKEPQQTYKIEIDKNQNSAKDKDLPSSNSDETVKISSSDDEESSTSKWTHKKGESAFEGLSKPARDSQNKENVVKLNEEIITEDDLIPQLNKLIGNNVVITATVKEVVFNSADENELDAVKEDELKHKQRSVFHEKEHPPVRQSSDEEILGKYVIPPHCHANYGLVR